VALLITVLVVIRDILILVLERAPRIKVIEEIVECVDILLVAFLISKFGYRLDAGEPALGFENVAPQLVIFSLFKLLLGRRLNISMFIDRVKLTALDGIEKDFSSLLNALEEAIILGTSSCSLFIRVMAENLLAVSTLDLFFGGFVAVL
jgi:hypothetical protein